MTLKCFPEKVYGKVFEPQLVCKQEMSKVFGLLGYEYCNEMTETKTI